MEKFIVVNPWKQGQSKGDAFECETLPAALRNHVMPTSQANEQGNRLAHLESRIAELEAENKVLAAKLKPSKAK